MRYWKYAAERCVNGTVVQRWPIVASTSAAAVRSAKELTRQLPPTQARTSIVRLVGRPLTDGHSPTTELPIIAFKKGAGNRVLKV